MLDVARRFSFSHCHYVDFGGKCSEIRSSYLVSLGPYSPLPRLVEMSCRLLSSFLCDSDDFLLPWIAEARLADFE